jgi:hypothetical protein
VDAIAHQCIGIEPAEAALLAQASNCGFPAAKSTGNSRNHE